MLFFVFLTGCAHLTQQEWRDIVIGPASPAWQELRQKQIPAARE
jgi:hypothetical protein